MLSYRKHIETTIAACNQKLNFIRHIANQSWGGDRKTLIKIFKATVMEKILYGAPLLSAVNKKLIDNLQKIQNKAMRTISGAFYTSPIKSLLAEIGLTDIENMIHQRTAKICWKDKKPKYK